MFASPYGVALLNLCQALPRDSVNFMTKMEAYNWLKDHTGQDFGLDPLKWEEWCQKHRKLYPGWGGISSVIQSSNK